MTQPMLTQFQQSAEQAIVSLLAERGLTVSQREVLGGTIPFYSKEPQVAVQLTAGKMKVWLFDDEANVSGSNESRFERADFDSTDQLLVALLDHIREEISI